LAIVNPNAQGYSLEEGLIRYKKKVWIGTNSALQTKIIQTFHASTLGAFRHLAYISKSKQDVMVEGYQARGGILCEAV
jgi:hypothetical protein